MNANHHLDATRPDPTPPAAPAQPVHAPVDGSCPPLSVDELLDRCMGNLDLALRLLQKSEQRLEEDVATLGRCQAAGAAEELARVAHRLKGAAANLGAGALSGMAAEIERLGRQGQLEQVPACLDRLRGERDRVADYTRAFLKQGQVD